MAGLPRQDQARVIAAVKALAQEPRPSGCRPVKGADRGTYRVRVGDFRVVYVVLDDERTVILARVTRRSESTYRGLR
ncbi:MAG: type II toxin-antitoxin system RelE/ParE family toxin [Anaerolineae bacterium]|nr:MAG: type II toxin-antitoxin system RelE/ParE family toxin [Anaerolineae bacterium]